MESNRQEDFVNQEEVDLLQENENSLGIVRSYECGFCKRGFNTAQALGGHMNIHRKDRARNKPSDPLVVVNSDKHITDQDPRFYHHIISPTSNQTHQDYQYSSHHHHGRLHPQFINHGSSSSSYFQSSAASPEQPFFQNQHYFNNQWFNPFGFDQWSMSFNMPCGSSAHVEDIEKSRRGVGQEEELDLELRLGGP